MSTPVSVVGRADDRLRVHQLPTSTSIRPGFFDNRCNVDGLTGRLATPIISNINSSVVNHLYATQFGFRFRWSRRGSRSASSPRRSWGSSNYSAGVYTNNLRDSTLVLPTIDDGETFSRYDRHKFLPGLDLG